MGPQRVRHTAVADAGPLIHLAEIDSLDLFSLFDPIVLPKAVLDEIDRGGLPDGMHDLSYEIIEIEDASVAPDKLDVGERQAVTLADERGLILLTDDLAARKAAIEREIEVHGSIGVIAFGFGQGKIHRQEAASRMRALQHETSLFITEGVVEEGIKLLNETE